MLGFSIVKKLAKGYALIGKVNRIIDEGKDLEAVYITFEKRYASLDDDIKMAWKEAREFLDAVRDLSR